MALEARIEKALARMRGEAELPLAVELWSGRRIALGETPTVTLRIPTRRALKYLARADLAKLGEAYVEGHIEVEGPIGDALRAAAGLALYLGGAKKGRLPLLGHLHTRRRDSKVVRYHYDVSNDFYALWLDRNMVYSCAYYRSGDEDIDTAQEQKLDHICRKLRLEPGDRFLDIGCGWGALVMWAASRYGADATGITLSHNQHALANERIRAAGLGARCRVLLQDYRDVPGEGVFDKIASVGMFEHVGLRKLPQYFGVIHRLLAEDGIALNHGITSIDPQSRSVGLGAGDFIDRYVFPDGELPHLSLLLREMGAAGLEVTDVETLRLHYARTLRAWSARLEANLEAARASTDEKRLRIWRAYLAGCAHGFENGWMTIQQVLTVKAHGRYPLPLSREFMYR